MAESTLYDLCCSLIPNYDPTRDSKGFTFNHSKAQDSVDFIEKLTTHTKGEKAGEPMLLEPWQKSIVGNTFGWEDDKGIRRYREVFIYIPRKNGKSLLIASMGNLLFFADSEKGSEIYCCAQEKEQASLIWNMSKQQVINEPLLLKNCKIYTGSKSIVKEYDGSYYRPISADADTKHGFNAHGALIDEIHIHKSDELFNVLATSTGSRKQPLIISATTADYSRKSLCNDKLKYCHDVQDGTIKDPRFLPVVYETLQDADWTSEDTWKKANPNYGISVSKEYIARECEKAKNSPTYENTFKRLHLNMMTEADVRWLQLAKWDKCSKPFDTELLKGELCFGGLDLSSTIDISALVLYFPKYGVLLSSFWIPEDNMRARELKDKVPYETWSRQGHIEATEGDVIDYRYIRQRINEYAQLYDIQEIGYDPYNARQLAIALDSEDGISMSEFRQGFITMNEPCKAFEKAVLGAEINHLSNPVLRWMAGNVTVARDPSDNYRPDKKRSTEKIDGIVSSIMAYGLSILNEDKKRGSVYESRGLTIL